MRNMGPPRLDFQIPGYQIQHELGRGASARVFAATREATGQPVAIKVFHPELTGSDEFKRRILSEVKAVSLLKHPHIVPVVESVPKDQPQAIVFERVEGLPLSEFQKRLPYLLPEISVLVLIEILDALACAHASGRFPRRLP